MLLRLLFMHKIILESYHSEEKKLKEGYLSLIKLNLAEHFLDLFKISSAITQRYHFTHSMFLQPQFYSYPWFIVFLF